MCALFRKFRKLQALMTKRYPAEVRLLLDGGKLVRRWANVRRHCLIQAMAAEVMADLLGLEEQIKRRLASVAVAHDWKKRLDLCPSDFSKDENDRAIELERKANLDKELMDALTPQFLLRVRNRKAMFLQLVQFYLDDITQNDQIVPFDDRVAEAEKRIPDPEPAVTGKLNQRYWDVEREVGHQVERMLFEILKARHVPVASAKKIPELILAEIKQRIAVVAPARKGPNGVRRGTAKSSAGS